MAIIALEGMKFYAHHGVYEAEQKIGADYIVDVYIGTVITPNGEVEDLEKTINYESVFQLCKMEMSKPRKLLETVVTEIVKRLKGQFPNMMALKVRVRKLHPPLGGPVAAAWVEEDQMFMQTCPRCNKQFINYDPGDCWKRFPNLHPATRETLERQYPGKCLCDACLKFYAG